MSGVASIAQSSTLTPPQSSVLPSLGLSPSTPSSSVTVTSILFQPIFCVASSTPIVTTQSSRYFHTRRYIFLNPTWNVNPGPSRSQSSAAEAPPASSAVSTTPVILGSLTFEEYLLAVQQQSSQGSQPLQAPGNP